MAAAGRRVGSAVLRQAARRRPEGSAVGYGAPGNAGAVLLRAGAHDGRRPRWFPARSHHRVVSARGRVRPREVPVLSRRRPVRAAGHRGGSRRRLGRRATRRSTRRYRPTSRPSKATSNNCSSPTVSIPPRRRRWSRPGAIRGSRKVRVCSTSCRSAPSTPSCRSRCHRRRHARQVRPLPATARRADCRREHASRTPDARACAGRGKLEVDRSAIRLRDDERLAD